MGRLATDGCWVIWYRMDFTPHGDAGFWDFFLSRILQTMETMYNLINCVRKLDMWWGHVVIQYLESLHTFSKIRTMQLCLTFRAPHRMLFSQLPITSDFHTNIYTTILPATSNCKTTHVFRAARGRPVITFLGSRKKYSNNNLPKCLGAGDPHSPQVQAGKFYILNILAFHQNVLV